MPQQKLHDLIVLCEQMDIAMSIMEVTDIEDLVYRKLNRFHEQASGMSSVAVEGKRPDEVLGPRAAHNLIARYMNCVNTRAPFTYEEVLDLPDGELWWQTVLSPIMFEDDQVIGVIGASIDITARKRREISDAKALAELRKLNEEINMYTSMAAHDVRGPLRKIKVIGELISADMSVDPQEPDAGVMLHGPQRALITSISQIAEKTLAHIDSILSYSRALSLTSEVELEPIDLGLLCADLVSLVDGDAQLRISYPHTKIMVERVALQIVLRNLLENAVRFATSACTIEVMADARESGDLIFKVSDDGPGFAPGEDPFSGTAASSLQSAMSGFGLASAKRIIETRGCSIWLDGPQGWATGSGAVIAFTTRGHIVKEEEGGEA